MQTIQQIGVSTGMAIVTAVSFATLATTGSRWPSSSDSH